jgi:F0F1-type ATP synthase delta subunit
MSKTYINSYASVLFEIAYDKKQINNYLDMSERLLVCLKNDDTHLFHVINNLAYSKTERKQIMSSILKILNAHPLEHFI